MTKGLYLQRLSSWNAPFVQELLAAMLHSACLETPPVSCCLWCQVALPPAAGGTHNTMPVLRAVNTRQSVTHAVLRNVIAHDLGRVGLHNVDNAYQHMIYSCDMKVGDIRRSITKIWLLQI